MGASKLILCICGGGINTSLNAKNQIIEYLQANGMSDVEVIHAMIGDIPKYAGRENMVAVWMTKIDPNFDAPGIRGMQFVIGSKKSKAALVVEIVEKLTEVCNG